jgi:hypothetical protein
LTRGEANKVFGDERVGEVQSRLYRYNAPDKYGNEDDDTHRIVYQFINFLQDQGFHYRPLGRLFEDLPYHYRIAADRCQIVHAMEMRFLGKNNNITII